MENVILEVAYNNKVGQDIYQMRLLGDTKAIKNYDEFIEIKLDGYYLRRPISVMDFGDGYVDILYKVLGHGTKDMSSYKPGLKLDVLIGLGNGFDITKSKKPLLIAGGIGVAPLIGLAKGFNKLGIKPTFIYGARSKDDIVMTDLIKEYADLKICTDDGSLGFKGNVVSYLKSLNVDYDYYYACGPQVMLKFLALDFTNGEVSLEARMGCGFGACMGCSIETTSGPKRVCKEGPVFMASEVKF